MFADCLAAIIPYAWFVFEQQDLAFQNPFSTVITHVAAEQCFVFPFPSLLVFYVVLFFFYTWDALKEK